MPRSRWPPVSLLPVSTCSAVHPEAETSGAWSDRRLDFRRSPSSPCRSSCEGAGSRVGISVHQRHGVAEFSQWKAHPCTGAALDHLQRVDHYRRAGGRKDQQPRRTCSQSAHGGRYDSAVHRHPRASALLLKRPTIAKRRSGIRFVHNVFDNSHAEGRRGRQGRCRIGARPCQFAAYPASFDKDGQQSFSARKNPSSFCRAGLRVIIPTQITDQRT